MEIKKREFMSFAIIETGGKQYKVSASKILEIEKLKAKVGETIKFNNVLLLNDDKNTEIGSPKIDGATVEAKLLNNVKDIQTVDTGSSISLGFDFKINNLDEKNEMGRGDICYRWTCRHTWIV